MTEKHLVRVIEPNIAAESFDEIRDLCNQKNNCF